MRRDAVSVFSVRPSGKVSRTAGQLVLAFALAVLGVLVVGCSSSAPGETGSADEPTAATVDAVAPSTGVSVGQDAVLDGEEEDPEAVQDAYLADGVLTDEEYEAAFNAFMDCANDGGARVEIRGVDPESGQILYRMWYDEGYEIGEACYNKHFQWVDGWFQTTDPVMLRQGEERVRDGWTRHIVPCLESFGIEVPEHLDGTENMEETDEATPFYDLFFEYVKAGSCE